MENYYDQISKGYLELHREEQIKKIQIIKDNFEFNDSDLVLDVGCGPCFLDIQCNLIGVDPSIELLKITNIKKICGFAENLPFKDHKFDIVVSITAIQNFTDLEKGLKEIKRVGKRKFILTFLKKSKNTGLIGKLISETFVVDKIVEEDKDLIFFCN